MKHFFKSIVIALGLFVLTSCSAKDNADIGSNEAGKLKVTTTTNVVGDIARQIGKDKIELKELMGAGVDPHLYQPTSQDVKTLNDADLILYSGLHLEGKMADVFKSLEQKGKKTVAVAENIDQKELLGWDEEGAGAHDPHIWWSPKDWKEAVIAAKDALIESDDKNREFYEENAKQYLKEIDGIIDYSTKRVSEIPEAQRVLVTAHDAFNYFARDNGFEVKAIQGISTDSEASAGNINELASFIAEHKIKAIFVESSVPKKNIEALQEAVKSKGFEVQIGGELYSDALGEDGSYVNAVKKNIDTIVDALK